MISTILELQHGILTTNFRSLELHNLCNDAVECSFSAYICSPDIPTLSAADSLNSEKKDIAQWERFHASRDVSRREETPEGMTKRRQRALSEIQAGRSDYFYTDSRRLDFKRFASLLEDYTNIQKYGEVLRSLNVLEKCPTISTCNVEQRPYFAQHSNDSSVDEYTGLSVKEAAKRKRSTEFLKQSAFYGINEPLRSVKDPLLSSSPEHRSSGNTDASTSDKDCALKKLQNYLASISPQYAKKNNIDNSSSDVLLEKLRDFGDPLVKEEKATINTGAANSNNEITMNLSLPSPANLNLPVPALLIPPPTSITAFAPLPSLDTIPKFNDSKRKNNMDLDMDLDIDMDMDLEIKGSQANTNKFFVPPPMPIMPPPTFIPSLPQPPIPSIGISPFPTVALTAKTGKSAKDISMELDLNDLPDVPTLSSATNTFIPSIGQLLAEAATAPTTPAVRTLHSHYGNTSSTTKKIGLLPSMDSNREQSIGVSASMPVLPAVGGLLLPPPPLPSHQPMLLPPPVLSTQHTLLPPPPTASSTKMTQLLPQAQSTVANVIEGKKSASSSGKPSFLAEIEAMRDRRPRLNHVEVKERKSPTELAKEKREGTQSPSSISSSVGGNPMVNALMAAMSKKKDTSVAATQSPTSVLPSPSVIPKLDTQKLPFMSAPPTGPLLPPPPTAGLLPPPPTGNTRSGASGLLPPPPISSLTNKATGGLLPPPPIEKTAVTIKGKHTNQSAASSNKSASSSGKPSFLADIEAMRDRRPRLNHIEVKERKSPTEIAKEKKAMEARGEVVTEPTVASPMMNAILNAVRRRKNGSAN